MYDGIRKAVGTTKKLRSLLKSATREILYSRDEQLVLDKCVQHFYLLYSKQNIITNVAIKYIESLSTIDDLDSEPTIEELSEAITEMASWKAPGSIPNDLFRQCKSCLLPLLHDILVKFWRE